MTESADITIFIRSNKIIKYVTGSATLASNWIVAKEIKSFLEKLVNAACMIHVTFLGTIIDGVFYIEKVRDERVIGPRYDNALNLINITYNAIGGSKFVKIGGIRIVSCFDDVW